jgi:mannose-6-phosphate isomerase-like protein (cupin superfamily)
MSYRPVNFAEKFGLLREQWTPKVVAEMNDYQFKLVRLEGDFVWHEHKDTDETFIVLDGELRIDFRDGAVTLSRGEMFVVPKGVEHKPFAKNEVKLLLIEPRGVLNTGDAGGDRTAQNERVDLSFARTIEPSAMLPLRRHAEGAGFLRCRGPAERVVMGASDLDRRFSAQGGYIA